MYTINLKVVFQGDLLFSSKTERNNKQKMSFSGCILRTLVGRIEKKDSRGGFLTIGDRILEYLGGKTTAYLFTHDLTPDYKQL